MKPRKLSRPRSDVLFNEVHDASTASALASTCRAKSRHGQLNRDVVSRLKVDTRDRSGGDLSTLVGEIDHRADNRAKSRNPRLGD
jgi:hypothetical protein